jgi:uncharacterized membrane protein YfcA
MEWTALPVGIVIATLATMVGLGGGILWAPYLMFVAGMEPSDAIFTSLTIQIAGMGSGGVTALLRKRTDLRLSLLLAAASFPGVAVGVFLQGIIEPASLVFILGASCLATALVFVSAREDYGFTPARKTALRSLAPYLWIPPILSVLTGLLSIGVGDFLVPVLRSRLGMKMDAAIGACLILMAINAVVAASLHVLAGEWFSSGLVIWAVCGVLIGGQVGPRLADRISDQALKEIFIYGLSLVGIHILFNA